MSTQEFTHPTQEEIDGYVKLAGRLRSEHLAGIIRRTLQNIYSVFRLPGRKYRTMKWSDLLESRSTPS